MAPNEDSQEKLARDRREADLINQTYYEVGKDFIKRGVTVGREFCKTMITVSAGGIPIYLGLLKLVIKESSSEALPGGFFTIFPAVLFLIATIICSIGYMPKIVQPFSVARPGEVMYSLGKLSMTGWWFALAGLVFFVAATALGIWRIALFL